MAAALLWLIGGLMMMIAPFVIDSNSDGKPHRGIMFVLIVLGALCWRAA